MKISRLTNVNFLDANTTLIVKSRLCIIIMSLIDTNQSECKGVKKNGSKFANSIATIRIIGSELHAL